MSAFGPNAGWLHNIRATPYPEVFIGSQRFTAAYRVLDPEEAILVVRGYEQRNRVIAPAVRLVLSCLLGWRYSGSEGDRRRLVTQLLIIAFRPQSRHS